MRHATRHRAGTALRVTTILSAPCWALCVSLAHAADDPAARVRKADFDARARVACAQERGQVLGKCDAAVARSPDGDAAVRVTFDNGFGRTLYFEGGSFVSANATMSGNGTDTDYRLDDDLHVIRVDDQRYEVPVAFVSGD